MPKASCHNITALKTAFREVARPWLVRVLKDADVDLGVSWYGVSLPLNPSKLLPRGARIRFASYLWLQPHHPARALADLPNLQRAVNLTDEHLTTFAASVRDSCMEVLRTGKNDDLELWIYNRAVLLDFVIDGPPEFRSELQQAAIGLRSALDSALLNTALAKLTGNVDLDAQVCASATDILSQAMRGAALTVNDVLGPSGCPHNANLMIPVRSKDDSLRHTSDLHNENWAVAERLWAGMPRHSQRLVVVAESDDAQHLGFWVPIVRGSAQEELPGGTAAFHNMVGSAVFKEGLPELIGFPSVITDRWRAHMNGDSFQESLFVALPFVVAQPPTGAPEVRAVLNVNAIPPQAEGWRRGYHREWLETARNRVAQFLEIACKALVIQDETRGGTHYESLRGSGTLWGSLPRLSAHKQAALLGTEDNDN